MFGWAWGEEETWKWVKASGRRPQHRARIYSAVMDFCHSITAFYCTHTHPAKPCWGKVIHLCAHICAHRWVYTHTLYGSVYTSWNLLEQIWEWQQSIKDMSEYIKDSQRPRRRQISAFRTRILSQRWRRQASMVKTQHLQSFLKKSMLFPVSMCVCVHILLCVTVGVCIGTDA